MTPLSIARTKLPASLEPYRDRVEIAMRAARAKSTEEQYAGDFRAFARWCLQRELPPVPASPATICAFLTDLALENRAATLSRRLAGIAAAQGDSPSLYLERCKAALKKSFEISEIFRKAVNNGWAEALAGLVPGRVLFALTRPGK